MRAHLAAYVLLIVASAGCSRRPQYCGPIAEHTDVLVSMRAEAEVNAGSLTAMQSYLVALRAKIAELRDDVAGHGGEEAIDELRTTLATYDARLAQLEDAIGGLTAHAPELADAQNARDAAAKAFKTQCDGGCGIDPNRASKKADIKDLPQMLVAIRVDGDALSIVEHDSPQVQAKARSLGAASMALADRIEHNEELIGTLKEAEVAGKATEDELSAQLEGFQRTCERSFGEKLVQHLEDAQ